MTSIFGEGKSWDTPPKAGELFMIVANALDEEGCDFYLIWRYEGPNPSFEEQFKEWHEVTPQSVYKWLQNGENVINISGKN